ncbi:ArsR/SmtB family transcription factor [Saccharomonospora iraqiensis]|uniref:ArsR/SmtB family transcription factor n=1 Tax=Saccharomonospora iraqiensis TaxID=52698 RepID=UPI0003FEFDBB|nr:metalloregulator ArsR/SmtB family transcription factor [Saccharomonospora iraqiensis]
MPALDPTPPPADTVVPADTLPTDTLPTDVLRLLADPLRATLVGLLARETLCTCHLVDETGASQTNISNHLRLLRGAGLVAAEPHGRYTYYRLRPEALRALAATLTGLAERAEAAGSEPTGNRRPC